MGSMALAVMICCACAAVCATVLILWRSRQRRLLERLEKMIGDAADGRFSDSCFDESMYSSLENQLARYLTATQMSDSRSESEKESIRTLISDIAHQTKTPVANMKLYSELMEETDMSEEAKEYLMALRSQAEKLSFLTSALVKMSRLETGMMTLHPEAGDIRELAEKTAAAYMEKAASKGLKMEVRGPEVKAFFDSRWTGEALGNIVDNAVKYTEQGSITIRTKKYEMFAAVEVADTGPGMPEEEIPKIFFRFYRGAGHHDEDGVGIGLYLAREIVSAGGGYIKAVSHQGKGSVFSLFLPLPAGKDAARDLPAGASARRSLSSQ